MHTKYTPRNDETFETARRTVERSRDKMQQAPELVAPAGRHRFAHGLPDRILGML